MISPRARDIHFSSVVVDCHADSIGRVVDHGADLGKDNSGGHLDLPRMRTGNLSAEFFACFVHPDNIPSGRCVRRALDMIDAVKRMCAQYPEEIELARTAGDVRRIAAVGRRAAILCVEGGHAIDDDLAVLRQFFELGVRYMTLTWNNTNNWADSWREAQRHNGLTDFGREVVREMNRLGMLVDVSHASEETFWAALDASEQPLIASHSSARALCEHPRNLKDEQIKALGGRGGVVCVNFVPAFISQAYNDAEQALHERRHWEEEYLEAEHIGQPEALAEAKEALKTRYDEEVPSQLPVPTVPDIVDHLEHVIHVAGVDHVGLGSDFDGVGSLPAGMEDCSKLPSITEELLLRGHSEDDVRKVLGENVLRLMERVIGG